MDTMTQAQPANTMAQIEIPLTSIKTEPIPSPIEWVLEPASIKQEPSDVAEISGDVSPAVASDVAVSRLSPEMSEEHANRETMLDHPNSTEESTASKTQRKKETERKFACSVCGKAFMHIGHYNRHKKLHTEKVLPQSGDVSELVTLQPRVSGLVTLQPKVPELVTLQPKVSGLVPLKPKVSGLVSLQQNVSGLVPLKPKVSGLVALQQNVSGLVPLKPKVSGLVTLQPKVSGLVTLQPKVSDSVTVQPDRPFIDVGNSTKDLIVPALLPVMNVAYKSPPLLYGYKGTVTVQPETSLTELKQKINRSFVCSICGKGFGRNSHLKRHIKLHETDLFPSANDPPSDSLTPQAESIIVEAGLVSNNDDVSPVSMEHHSQVAPDEPEVRAKSPIFVDPDQPLSVKSEPPVLLDSSDIVEVKSEPPFLDSENSGGPSSLTGSISMVDRSNSRESLDRMDTSVSSDGHSSLLIDPSELLNSSQDNLMNMMNHEIEKNWSCLLCGKLFVRKSHLTRHMKLHTTVECHDCQICGKNFLQKAYLKAHMNTVHAAVKEELEKVYSCCICNKQFGRMSHLKRHMKLHVGGKTYDCSICGKSFLQNSNLKSHEKSHADLMSSIDEGLIKRHVNEETNTEYFDCEQCGKSFQLISSLKAHINTVHVGPKIFDKCFDCSFCGKQFGRNSHLKRHLKLHTGGKTYTCELCGRVFMQNGNLKAHIRMVHLKERSHQCNVCGKMFLQQSNLNTHIRTHTGEKPYECSICGRDFTQGNQLKYHMRTHFGETPFSCLICGKRFTNNRSCKRHMRTHTGDKPFTCGICNKNFYQDNQLKVHMRTHTGEKPFACHICGKEFTNNRGRNRHVLAHSENGGVIVDEMEDYSDDMMSDSEDYEVSNEIIGPKDIKDEIVTVIKEEIHEMYDDYASDFESTSESDMSDSIDEEQPNPGRNAISSIGEDIGNGTKGSVDHSTQGPFNHQQNVIHSVNEAIRVMTKGGFNVGKKGHRIGWDVSTNVVSSGDRNPIVDPLDADLEDNPNENSDLPKIVSAVGASSSMEEDLVHEEPVNRQGNVIQSVKDGIFALTKNIGGNEGGDLQMVGNSVRDNGSNENSSEDSLDADVENDHIESGHLKIVSTEGASSCMNVEPIYEEPRNCQENMIQSVVGNSVRDNGSNENSSEDSLDADVENDHIESGHLKIVSTEGASSCMDVEPIFEEPRNCQENVIQSLNETILTLTRGSVRSTSDDHQVNGNSKSSIVSSGDRNLGSFDADVDSNDAENFSFPKNVCTEGPSGSFEVGHLNKQLISPETLIQAVSETVKDAPQISVDGKDIERKSSRKDNVDEDHCDVDGNQTESGHLTRVSLTETASSGMYKEEDPFAVV